MNQNAGQTRAVGVFHPETLLALVDVVAAAYLESWGVPALGFRVGRKWLRAVELLGWNRSWPFENGREGRAGLRFGGFDGDDGRVSLGPWVTCNKRDGPGGGPVLWVFEAADGTALGSARARPRLDVEAERLPGGFPAAELSARRVIRGAVLAAHALAFPGTPGAVAWEREKGRGAPLPPRLPYLGACFNPGWTPTPPQVPGEPFPV